MKGTGIAHPIQGLICPHGYSNRELRLYPVEGIYACLSRLRTRTTIEILQGVGENSARINGQIATGRVKERIEKTLASFGNAIPKPSHYRITSVNDFPERAGLGSSSSAFAALVLAVNEALSLGKSRTELSIHARQGACSAAGSVMGGISVLRTGINNLDGFAVQLVEPNSFPFVVLIIKDETSNSPGRFTEDVHQEAITSPLFQAAADATQRISNELQKALLQKDWMSIGELVEQYLHINYAVIMTGKKNLLLWKPETLRIFGILRRIKLKYGRQIFYSMNTGSNVFVYTPPKLQHQICRLLLEEGIEAVPTFLGGPATASADHLIRN